MDDILKEVNSVIGVRGSFVCNADGQVLHTCMPDEFGPEILSDVGRILTQTMSGLQLARRGKVWEIDMVYDRDRVVAKSIGEGCLCILGSPNANIHFLNLTANLAVKKIQRSLRAIEAFEARQVLPAMSEAVRELVEFVNRILDEVERRGVRREDLSKILEHRLSKLRNAHPVLDDFLCLENRLEFVGLPETAADGKEAREGMELLVHGMCLSLKGLLGQDQAEAAYDSVYGPYFEAHESAFVRVGIGDEWRDIVLRPLPSAHSGVEISLD